MNKVFPLKESRNYCTRFPFKSQNVHTVAYGTETLNYMGPKLWSLIPKELREVQSLIEFKKKIKLWKPDNCPCRICKIYIAGLGFIDNIEYRDF